MEDGDNKNLLNEIDKLEDDKEASSIKKEKSNSQEKAFSIIIIIIIVIALAILYLFYKGSYIVGKKENMKADFSSYLENNYDEYEEEESEEFYDEEDSELYESEYDLMEKQSQEKFEIQKPNLSIISQTRGINNKLIITLHNGNQEDISNLLVQVIFYDGENKPIKIDAFNIGMLSANSDYIIPFEGTPETYERYDFLITKDYYLENISLKDNITYEVENKNDELIISGKNDSDKKISVINFGVVYYNEENQIIDIEFVEEFDIKKKRKFEIFSYLDVYDRKTYEPVSYSRYEVVLLEAYAYEEI